MRFMTEPPVRREADVVIVGAGCAGSVAAARAQELGRRVLLLEKAEEEPAGGNTKLSGGIVHAAWLNMMSDPEQVVAKILQDTDGLARRELAWSFACNCGRAIRWLAEHGVTFEPLAAEPVYEFTLAPHRPLGDLHGWPGKGPHRLLEQLQKAFVQRGGQIWRGATALELVLATGRRGIAGLVVRDRQGVHLVSARSVILADGGFQGNPAMLQLYVGRFADRLFLRGSPAATGDALRMSQEIGAKLVNMQYLYGHCLSLDARHNDRLWPYPSLDPFIEHGILVDRRGLRVVDENVGGVGVVNGVARLDDPLGTAVVVDEEIWDVAGRSVIPGTPAPNQELEGRGATIYQGRSIREAAEKARINPDQLARTVQEFNQAAADGRGRWLSVPRTGFMKPLDKPPFRVIPMVPGVTFTMGGVLVNGQAQALDLDERPIPGLYAAGGTMGGLQGGPRGGYVGGLAEALVFALMAAESAAEQREG